MTQQQFIWAAKQSNIPVFQDKDGEGITTIVMSDKYSIIHSYILQDKMQLVVKEDEDNTSVYNIPSHVEFEELLRMVANGMDLDDVMPAYCSRYLK